VLCVCLEMVVVVPASLNGGMVVFVVASRWQQRYVNVNMRLCSCLSHVKLMALKIGLSGATSQSGELAAQGLETFWPPEGMRLSMTSNSIPPYCTYTTSV
jgi:hypothetical protein